MRNNLGDVMYDYGISNMANSLYRRNLTVTQKENGKKRVRYDNNARH